MLIITGDYGRLGNALRRFAHVLALAFETGQSVVNLSFYPFRHALALTEHGAMGPFRLTASDPQRLPTGGLISGAVALGLERLSQQWCHRQHRTLDHIRWTHPLPGIQWCHLPEDQELCLADSIDMARLQSCPITGLDGYGFLNRSLLLAWAPAVRSWLRPAPSVEQHVQNLVQSVRSDQATWWVGVHIRQGDYRQFMGGQYFFNGAVYRRHMEALQRFYEGRGERVAFWVCSDEPVSPTTFEGLPVRVAQGTTPMADMMILAQCQVILSAPSSFPVWASFYGSVPQYFINSPTAPLSYVYPFTVP